MPYHPDGMAERDDSMSQKDGNTEEVEPAFGKHGITVQFHLHMELSILGRIS